MKQRLLSILLAITVNGWGQQNVFNRSESGTGDWGSGNLPWYYQTSNNNQGDPDNNNTTRNDVFVGHNVNTTMTLNGRFYLHRDFTFEAATTSQRSIGFSGGGGFSFTRSLKNQSPSNHIFNAPVGIDANNAEIAVNNASGKLTFNSNVFTNGNQVFFRGTGAIEITGAMTQSGALVKQGSGVLILSGNADYAGNLFIDQNIVRINRSLGSGLIDVGSGVQEQTANNAILEIESGTFSKAITTKNFGTGAGSRSIKFTNTTGIPVISSSITMEKNTEISAATEGIISGAINGVGIGFSKTGNGLLSLTAQNNYTGTTTVTAGTLQLNRTSGGTLPASNNIIVENGGILRISTNQTLATLTLNNGTVTVDNGVVLTVINLITNGGTASGTGSLRITDVLTVNAGLLNTGNIITLTSDASNTARVAEVGGTLNGNVTIERFIPAKRAWRALTAPLKGSNTSIFSSWQNNGSTIADTGLEIWGPAGTGMATGPGYSVLQYTATGYVNVTNTQTTHLFETSKNNAYLFFVTGAYGSENIGNTIPAEATTLKATGELITGDISYTNLIDTRHTMIGNPYASPLNPSLLLNGSTNLINKFWVWDPVLGVNGGYVSYDAVAGTYSNATGSYPEATTAIQSGQAFFVRATTGNTGSFTISESKKSAAVSDVFRDTNEDTATMSDQNPEIFRLGMYKQQNQSWLPLDGAIAVFYPSASDLVDHNDGRKFANGSENLAFRRNNTSLSSEHYQTITDQDTLYVRIWNTTPNTYKLHLNTEGFTTANLVAKLQDLYNNTETILDLSGAIVAYEFTVNAEVASSGDRFRVVFQDASALGSDDFSKNKIIAYPNPVTDGQIHVDFSTENTNRRYQLTNLLGQVVQSGHLGQSLKTVIAVEPLPHGLYLLQVSEETDLILNTKLLIQ